MDFRRMDGQGVDVIFAVHLRRKLEAWVDEFWMDGVSACHVLVSEEYQVLVF
jgi:hypothetical protein